ncbi:helix-turn-helix domain-containing protein [Lactobacillaceae bacterium Melli_B4]
MKFETTLIKARKRKKYTQAELGEKLHVSRKTISSWENGRSIPNPSFIKDIEEILDIKLNSNDNNVNSKSIDNKFNNYVLVFNTMSTILAIIDTAVPIFAFWIIMIQIVVNIVLFYNFNKQFKKIMKTDKFFIITVFLICVLSLTLAESEQIIRDTKIDIDFIIIIAMMLRSSIVTYGILFLLFFKKLWNH